VTFCACIAGEVEFTGDVLIADLETDLLAPLRVLEQIALSLELRLGLSICIDRPVLSLFASDDLTLPPRGPLRLRCIELARCM